MFLSSLRIGIADFNDCILVETQRYTATTPADVYCYKKSFD